MVSVIDGAVDTIVVAIGLLHSLGIDPFKAWDAVHRANMSKIVDGKVYLREDGQIGKPPGFVGPEEDLAKLWNGVEA
jgi:predicted HAD superfamily Cof-like phosphohydrolase